MSVKKIAIIFATFIFLVKSECDQNGIITNSNSSSITGIFLSCVILTIFRFSILIFNILSGCPGSYFQIDIERFGEFQDYTLIFNEIDPVTSEEISIISATNEDFAGTIYLASQFWELDFSVNSATDPLPFEIRYFLFERGASRRARTL